MQISQNFYPKKYININIEKFLFSFTYLKSVNNIVFKCQIVDTQIGKIVIFVTEELDIAR